MRRIYGNELLSLPRKEMRGTWHFKEIIIRGAAESHFRRNASITIWFDNLP
jgi:hypothetical protein